MATVTPQRPRVFNLANQLTAGRFVLAIILFILIAEQAWLWCVVVFALAAVTDWLDGYLARKQGLTSALGRVFDPLVDKVLICGAYIFALGIGSERTGLSPWMVTVVVARELIINGLRSYLEGRGVVFGADWLGKIKMALQCAALFGVFFVLSMTANDASPDAVTSVRQVRDLFIYSMIAVTALSGLQYLWRAALLLRAD